MEGGDGRQHADLLLGPDGDGEEIEPISSASLAAYLFGAMLIVLNSAHADTAMIGFGLLATFPFPHLLTLDATLRDRTLTVTTTVTATTGSRVPLCFGFHPYLQLPGVPRAQWRIETPAMRYQPVNAWGIPTGRVESRPAASEVLGDKFSGTYNTLLAKRLGLEAGWIKRRTGIDARRY